MQLRTGKKLGLVEKTPLETKKVTFEMKKPKNEASRLYIQEITTMMDELEEWSDCRSARIAGLVDIYEYIDEHCSKFNDLEKFHKAVGTGAKNIMSDITRLAPLSDEETLCQMKMLAPILVSVIAKLG
jgi:hypothetical protein